MIAMRYGLILGLSALVACGGGGGDTDPVPMPPEPPKPVNAAGLWVGSSSAGMDVRLLVDENLVLWGVSQDPITLASAAVQGRLAMDPADNTGSTFKGDFREYLADGRVVVNTAEAKVVSESSLSGIVTSPETVRFNTLFDRRFYDTGTLGQIQGNWKIIQRDAQGREVVQGTLNISTLGAVNGNGLAGTTSCTFAGNVVPVPARGGYFSLALQMGPSAGCRLPGLPMTGFVIVSSSSTGPMLSIALASEDRWQGASAVAVPLPPTPTPTPTPSN